MALPFITLEEAAEMAGVKVATIKKWTTTGICGPDGRRAKLLVSRIGGRDYTTEVVVAEFVRDNNLKRKATS